MKLNSHAAFSKNVETILAATDLRGAQLASLCGMAPARISELIGGRYGKTLDVVDAICDGLNRHFGATLRPEDLISESFVVPEELHHETHVG